MVPTLNKPAHDEKYKDAYHAYIQSLLQAYYLAEKHCMNDFMNKLLDKYQTFHSRLNKRISADTVIEICEKTHEGSALRRYAVALMVFFQLKSNSRAAVVDGIVKVCMVPEILLVINRFLTSSTALAPQHLPLFKIYLLFVIKIC